MPAIGHAQDVVREAGGEFGFDVLYEFSKEIRFEGGSTIDRSDDVGVALSFGYRFNPKWELQFLIDWNDIDYRGTLQSASFASLLVCHVFRQLGHGRIASAGGGNASSRSMARQPRARGKHA